MNKHPQKIVKRIYSSIIQVNPVKKMTTKENWLPQKIKWFHWGNMYLLEVWELYWPMSYGLYCREEDGQWKEDQKLEGHSDWVRDVAWAPSIGLPKSIIASCSQVNTDWLIHSLCLYFSSKLNYTRVVYYYNICEELKPHHMGLFFTK